MRLPTLTATLVAVSLLASGCFGGSSTSSTSGESARLHGPPRGTLEGKVFTTACGGPARSSCGREVYRGSLVFCRTMTQIGECPSARVGDGGRYEIRLRAGRYALIAAPGEGNVVMVRPRWVRIEAGLITVLSIDGGNLMK